MSNNAPAQNDWAVLSSEYKAENGLTVRPIGTFEAGVEFGRALNNGLMYVGESINPYYGWARQGIGQIIVIEDDSKVPQAGGFLRSRNGKVTVDFLRGKNNVEVTQGPAFDALQNYVQAYNDNKIERLLELGASGFILPEDPAEEVKSTKSLWALAGEGEGGSLKRFGRFVSLIMAGDARMRAAQADVTKSDVPSFIIPADEQGAWMGVSPSWKDEITGLIIEPVTSRNAMRIAAVDLESGFALPMVRDQATRAAMSGERQFLVVSNDSGVLGMVDVMVRGGLISPANGEGARLTELNPQVFAGVTNYLKALNRGQIPGGVAIGNNRFLVSNAVQDDMKEMFQDRPAALPTMQRTRLAGSDSVEGDDFDGDDFDGDNLDDDEVHPVSVEDRSWAPVIADDFKASNGVSVVCITSVAGALALGRQFENALTANGGDNLWTRKAEAGDGAILAFVDAEGDVIANIWAEMTKEGVLETPYDGPLAVNNHRAPDEAQEAWGEFSRMVNDSALAYGQTGTAPSEENSAVKDLMDYHGVTTAKLSGASNAPG